MGLILYGRHNLGILSHAYKVVNCACTGTTACRSVNSSVKNWTETHYQLERQTCPSQVEGQTRNRTRELYKDIRRYVLAHAGDLQFRFQHGPFTKRFKPEITRVPAVVLSISRFSRLAVARALLFALNQLTSEGTGSYSHFGPRPLRMSWLTCCCCTAVITCGIGLFHMARASSRLTSVQINTTKQFCLWGLAACLPPPPGAHICLKICANVFTPPRRLQGSVIDCKRNLQKDKGYCTKKKMSVHIFQVHPHIKIGRTPVRRTGEDHLSSLFHSGEFDEQASTSSLPRSWLLLSPRAQRYFLTFRHDVLPAVRCTWTKWQWKLVHSPYQHPPAPNLHRSLRAYLATLSLDTVEDVMVGEVDELEEDVRWSISCLEGVMDVEEGKLEEELVDKPGTTIAICFTCNRRRKSTCWRNSWQVFPHIFRSNFGDDITDLCIDCVDVQWLLALLVGGNLSSFSKKVFLNFSSMWVLWPPIEVDVLRTWSPPNSFTCPSAVFGIVTNLCEIISFALSFTLWNSDASILSTCSRSAPMRVPFQTSLPAYQTYSESVLGNAVLPNWWNFNRSKQKWSDIHSNEPNKILRLNWFVEAPFLKYFSQIVAIRHGIHLPSSGQLQLLRKGSFLHSAYRYSVISFNFER